METRTFVLPTTLPVEVLLASDDVAGALAFAVEVETSDFVDFLQKNLNKFLKKSVF